MYNEESEQRGSKSMKKIIIAAFIGILHDQFTVCHLDKGEIFMLCAARSLVVRASLPSG